MGKKIPSQHFDLDEYFPVPVVYQLRHSILNAIRKGLDPIPDIQGREEAKKDVLRALLSGTHPYLVSEEGTGKTRLARSLTRLLPPVPVIRGCPYHDDPKWSRRRLCPRCLSSRDPAREFGVEIIPGGKRFSRVQGNEYTNEAKLLGLKDIQAIAQGKSPSDPAVFTGTGIFRANRGILFIDELPAIPTKVQVLLHPLLEEKQVVLEEYNWQHPIDLVLIATGNPQGFSHVNEVPRPLLDRLEMIYFDLPSEEVEREIALMERFRVKAMDGPEEEEPEPLYAMAEFPEVDREAALPWWVLDVINKAVRQSRICRWLDRGASIRGTTRAVDHTYSTVELENRLVATLGDACAALKLALRGRVALRADLVDFDRPREAFSRTDEVVEDLMWSALQEMVLEFPEWNREKLAAEINSILSGDMEKLGPRIAAAKELGQVINRLLEIGRQRADGSLLTETEKKLLFRPQEVAPEVREEFLFSALEFVVNLAVHRGIIDEGVARQRVFVPQMVSWARRR